jgi:hypothetical protein
MCIGTRAFGPLDETWTGAAAGAAADVVTRVVSDALVLVDSAYRPVQFTTVASHSEFADCVERRIHTLGAMCTLTADGEAANHSSNVTSLRAHYGVSFARQGAPYHPHHNCPVETMVKLLKAVVVDMGWVAGLSIAAHWPLLIAHAANIINDMPLVSLQGRSARAALDGFPPNLRYFRTFRCAAVILAVGSYKNRVFLRRRASRACTSALGCSATCLEPCSSSQTAAPSFRNTIASTNPSSPASRRGGRRAWQPSRVCYLRTIRTTLPSCPH